MKIRKKFGRKRDQRRSFLKGLATNLLLKGKIKTTESRAKELRSFAERLIHKVKIGKLAGIRYAVKFLSKTVVKKINQEIAPRYKERAGGYTRIIKLGQRKSDSAKMAIIELV